MHNWHKTRSTMWSVSCAVMAVSALSWPSQAAVSISSKPTKNMSCVSGICTPTAKDAVLNATDLSNMLASGNVQVNTGTGKLARHVQNIEIGEGFSWASASALTLDAYNSIEFKKSVADSGTGAVTFKTNDGGTGGALRFYPKGRLSFLGTTNGLTINGKSYTLVNSLSSLASAVAANPSGFYALSANYDAKNDGAYGTAPVTSTFEGVFNGLGNTISRMTIHGGNQNINVGLFAEIDKAGVVSSVEIKGGVIKAEANSNAGLIVGVNLGSIFNVSASGSVAALAGKGVGSEAGGIAGSSNGAITEAAAFANVAINGSSSEASAYVGGLLGANDGTVTRSYATGSATAADGIGFSLSGGLLGFSDGPVVDCYALGATSIGARWGIGGLIGSNGYSVATSYSTGAPTATSGAYIGGSLGYDGSTSGSLSDLYWDTITSGITDPSQGAGSPSNDPGITGETTTQLQAGLPAGFDPTVWAENPSINGGLPYLIANPPE